MKYIKGLDTLRAFAIFFVLLWHQFPRQNIHTPIGAIEQFLLPTGVFGVNLFFVLSGFLITSILLKAREEAQTFGNVQVLRKFMIRRALRIFPIYYLFLFLLIGANYPFERSHLPYLFTYTENLCFFINHQWGQLGHLWSLSVEEQFYIVWPFVVLFTPQRLLVPAMAGFIAIALTTDVLLRHQLSFDTPETTFTLVCFDAFAIGGLYAYTLKNNWRPAETTRLINLAAAGAVLLSLYWKLAHYLHYYGHFQYFLRTVHSVLALWIIHQIVHLKPGWLKEHIVENKVLVGIGKISYGIYLFHWPVPFYVQKLRGLHPQLDVVLKDPVFRFPLYVMASILVATLSYFILERRLLKVKDRLFPYREKRKETTTNRVNVTDVVQ